MILKDKVCGVTGAAQGIGKAIALHMLSEGGIVYGCDRAEVSMAELESANPDLQALYYYVTDAQWAK